MEECHIGRREIAGIDNEKLSHHKGFRGINCSANEDRYFFIAHPVVSDIFVKGLHVRHVLCKKKRSDAAFG